METGMSVKLAAYSQRKMERIMGSNYERPICVAMLDDDSRCRSFASSGSNYCILHLSILTHPGDGLGAGDGNRPKPSSPSPQRWPLRKVRPPAKKKK
jgi:hypothetical protein